jgi:hypothetical protein
MFLGRREITVEEKEYLSVERPKRRGFESFLKHVAEDVERTEAQMTLSLMEEDMYRSLRREANIASPWLVTRTAFYRDRDTR